MKIVINKCYGGFGISIAALKELCAINAACIESCSPKDYYGGNNEKRKDTWEKDWERDLQTYIPIGDGFMAHPHEYNLLKEGILYNLKYGTEIRSDKDLVEVVERLGRLAASSLAELKVVEIPDEAEWYIDDYDGIETIHQVHASWD